MPEKINKTEKQFIRKSKHIFLMNKIKLKAMLLSKNIFF